MKSKVMLVAAIFVWLAQMQQASLAQLSDQDGAQAPAEVAAPYSEAPPMAPQEGYIGDSSPSFGQCLDEDDSCGCRSLDLWGGVEYLMWWRKGSHLPPIIGTSPPGTPLNNASVIGTPGYKTLYGDSQAGQTMQNGGRVTIGVWLDPQHNVGLGGRFFGLGGGTQTFNISSNSTGSPILGRPFFDVDLNRENAVLIAYPGLARGSIHTTYTNQFLGAEVFGKIMLEENCKRRFDLVGGYQFYRLDDTFRVNSTTTNIDPNGFFPLGTTVDSRDRFRAYNQFHGGSFGLQSTRCRGRWSILTLGKLAIGNMRQSILIDGSSTLTVPGVGSATQNGGVLALPSNIGNHVRDRFCFVPEFNTNLSYQLSQHVSVSIGYNLIWFSNVVTSTDQIDRNISRSQATPQPAFSFREQNYWVQGMNFGAAWDF